MVMWSIVVSIIFTIIILLLTLFTIQQGYGYKHTIDPPVTKDKTQQEAEDQETKE